MKQQLIGIILIAVAFAGLMWEGEKGKEAQRQALLEQQKAAAEQPTPATGSPDDAQIVNTAASSQSTATASGLTRSVAPEGVDLLKNATDAIDLSKEETFTIENKFLRVTFTNLGGAIKSVALIGTNPQGKLLYPATLKDETTPYVFNKLNPLPALALNWDKGGDGELSEFAPVYTLKAKKGNIIQFSLTLEDGVEIIRGYKLRSDAEEGDPYIIQHETRFKNTTEENRALSTIYVNAGTLPPTEGDLYNQYHNVSYYNDFDADMEQIQATEFINSNGFMGFASHRALPFVKVPASDQDEPIKVSWGGVKNQFFAGIITPDKPGNAVYADAYKMKDGETAIIGYLGFDFGILEANTDTTLGMDYYVGPMEYDRLAAKGKGQDELMQFGWGIFGFMAKMLLFALKGLHSALIHIAPEWAWGLAIVALTCIVKGALFPLTAMQIRSSKKMQAIAEPMKELREKYKDNPQKQQTEMMKLFKENQVNPAAGCLPLLVQLPIFFGLLFMLRAAAELRFGSFLWVQDLSVADYIEALPEIPESIPFIGGPIHILPILMTITMYYQMKMMPTPTTDNIQIKMMKYMPFFIFPFCYKFPAGVTLYWTMSNLLTILQTYLTRDMRNAPATLPSAQKETSKTANKTARKKGKK